MWGCGTELRGEVGRWGCGLHSVRWNDSALGDFDESPSHQFHYLRSVFRYQSLEAWKRAHAAAVLLLRQTDVASRPRTWSVFDQLRRAVVSVEANIVEGYALGSPRLYQRHIRIALGSAAEAECLARLAGELEYLPESVVKEVESLLGNTMRTLHGLLRQPNQIVSRRRLG